MKKFGLRMCLLASVLMLSTVSFTACSCSHEYDAGTVAQEATCSSEGVKVYKCTKCGEEKEESIPCVSHEYEESVEKEATFEDTGVLKFTCVNCGDTYTEEIPVKEKTVVVTVTGKNNLPKDINNGRYSDRVELDFSIDNQCDEAIKGIEGVLYIRDLFGKDILSMNCDFTGQTIAASTTTTVTGLGMDINEFLDDHVKFYNEDFSDLQFSYEISSIVYENDPVAVSEETDTDVPVTVTVTNKESVPSDIYNGQYSPRVEFTIDVYNGSEKEIKGISGTMTVKDLFGKDILSSTCDFTGEVIPAGQTVTFTDLGMDINEFMDDHTKLYNEKYEDLIFSYDLDTIVYTDGSSESF